MPESNLHDFLCHSLRNRWRRYRKTLGDCRTEFSPASVHRWRVANRRLFAFLILLNSVVPRRRVKAVERPLKISFKQSASLRDTHVHLLHLEELQVNLPPVAAFRDYLRRRERRLARQLAKTLRQGPPPEAEKAMRRLRRDLKALRNLNLPEETTRQTLLQAADLAFRRTQALRQRVNPAKPATVHRMRVAFKKFRYMVESLQPILPGVSRRPWPRMRAFQTMMGQIQDSDIFLAALDRYERKHAQTSLDAVRQAEVQRHAAWMETFLRHAGEIADFWPPTV